MLKKALFPVLAASLLALCACDVSVNRGRSLADGGRSSGMNTVNGSISLGAGCTVDGGCRTVNGGIRVGDNSRVEDLDTVNGRIAVGAGVRVDGDAQTVNGSFSAGAGSEIRGQVSTVNGRIELAGAVVHHDVATVNGDVLLRDRSLVRGDIVIRGRSGPFSGRRRLEIRLEGGSRVEGGIDVSDPDSEVTVRVSRDSEVKGQVRNARIIKE